MNETSNQSVFWLFWPFHMVWKLASGILRLTGRIACAAAGLTLMIAGILISLSIIGAPLGIPLAALGFLLLVRALF